LISEVVLWNNVKPVEVEALKLSQQAPTLKLQSDLLDQAFHQKAVKASVF
jgi:hypothetical protein